ncbi:MAG: NB-ARC domain-containing protein [Cyanobacteriota bacterium]
MTTGEGHRTWAEDIKKRVSLVFEVLLTYVIEESDTSKVDWHSGIEVEVWTKLEFLRYRAVQHINQLKDEGLKKELQKLLAISDAQKTRSKIGESLSQYIKKLLPSLDDKRSQADKSRGDWHFQFTLWHEYETNKLEQFKRDNLAQFDKAWDSQASQKTKAKRSSRGTNKSAQLSLTPYDNLGKAFGVRGEQFIGRDQTLDHLHQLLQQNDLVAIVGMAGVGKTELSIQYARSQLHTYQGGVCWLPAFDWRAVVVEFARPRFPNFNLPNELSLAEQVAYCWQHWPEGEVLLVLDDVTDYEQQVREDLPGDSRFKVLMTTREALGAPVEPLDLNVLEPDDALKLLKSLVKKTPGRFEQEQAFAARLCEWLEYLPLGLELVGRHLHLQPDLSLSVMLFQLQQQALKHESMDRDEVDPQRAMTANRGVQAAFELSWERLDDRSKHLGKLLSLFALAPIPWEYVELTEKYYCNLFNQGKGFSPEILKKARRKLVYFHLLKYLDQQTYILHSLIRKFFQSKLEELDRATN